MVITQKNVDALQSKLAFYLKRWRSYPLAFVIEACGAEKYGYPTLWQVEAMDAIRRHKKVAIRSGHGVGKTRFLAWLFWWFMVCWKTPGKNLKIPCTGPTGGNLEDVLWPEIKTVLGHMPKYFKEQFLVTADHVRYVGTTANDADTWFGSLRTARKENPDALQGFHAEPVLILADESSGIDDKIFEVGTGVLSSAHAYAVMTGNPTKLSGHFYRTFANPTGQWHLMHVDCRNELDDRVQSYPYVDPKGEVHMIEVVGRVNQGLVDHVAATYGEHSPEFAVRVCGEFPKSETASVVRQEWLDRLKYEEPWLEPHAKRILGLDPADVGPDATGCVVRHGKNIEDVAMVRNLDQDQIGEWVVGKYFELQGVGKQIDRINIDCTGVGAGAWAKVKNHPKMQPEFRQKRVMLGRVMMQESAPDGAGPQCYRLRDHLWWQVRLFFFHRRPWFADKTGAFKQLMKDLVVPMYSTDNGKVKIETKKDMRKRTGKSPDLGDACMLTFYADSQKRPEKEVRAKKDPHRKQREQKARMIKTESWKLK